MTGDQVLVASPHPRAEKRLSSTTPGETAAYGSEHPFLAYARAQIRLAAQNRSTSHLDSCMACREGHPEPDMLLPEYFQDQITAGSLSRAQSRNQARKQAHTGKST